MISNFYMKCHKIENRTVIFHFSTSIVAIQLKYLFSDIWLSVDFLFAIFGECPRQESKSSLAWEAVGEVMTAVMLHLNRPLMILVNPPEYLPYCLDSITILPEKKWTYFFVKPCHVNNIIMHYMENMAFFTEIFKSHKILQTSTKVQAKDNIF